MTEDCQVVNEHRHKMKSPGDDSEKGRKGRGREGDK